MRLALGIYLFLSLALAAPLIGHFALFADDMQENRHAALLAAAEARASSVQEALAQTLTADWRDLETAARQVNLARADFSAGLLEGLSGDGGRVVAAVLVSLEGRVAAASPGALAGLDVSDRSWFRNALRHGVIGPVENAPGDAQRGLQPARAGMAQLGAVMAVPVRRDGRTEGVLAVQIDGGWLRDSLAAFAEVGGLDLFVTAPDGTVLVSTDGSVGARADLAILRAARTGARRGAYETWPDGRDYVSVLLPQVQREMPSFGWRLIGRLDAEAALPGGGTGPGTGATAMLIAAGIIALMGLGFVQIFVRPIERLARSAQRIAAGQEVYPPQERNARELRDLSAALARMQQRLSARVIRDAPER